MKKTIIIVLLFSVSFLEAQNTGGDYTIKNLDLNTEQSEFGTAFFGSDKVVFSAPRTKKSLIKNNWKPNNQPYLDLYIGSVDKNGDIIDKQQLLGNINSKFHEAQVIFTKDLKTVYFTGNNFSNNIEKNDTKGNLRLQLFKASVLADGSWGAIKKLPFNSDEYSTGHPALNKDETKLYFVSDRPESIGETDIYVIDILSDGTFSEPINLGPRINTKEKEVFPFISSDGVLYFSSNRHESIGGLDVFASKITATAFSKVMNLGRVINSKKDDFAFIIDANIKKGYVSSNRRAGKGDDDIYNVEVVNPLVIECKQLIRGVVRDKNSVKAIVGALVNVIDANGTTLQSVNTQKDGAFSIEMACNSSYKIMASKEDFESQEKMITTADDFDSRTIEVSLSLTSTKEQLVEEKINVNPIYFDLNSWDIRKDAARELDKVVDFMKKNPKVIVESRSHTDARGKDKNNLILSEKRANSTAAYIISKGIDSNRINGKGFGETELLNKCANFVKCTKAEHQMNRRTEFVIIK